MIASRVADAYARGVHPFMGLELLCAPGALVPREETELLGMTAVRLLEARAGGAPTVIDMCCGSGNLACALAVRLPGARLWASDLTDGCVALARRNVAHLGLGERVAVAQGDLFAPLAGKGLEGTVAAVVCNPPYISSGKLARESAHLLEREPREAFDGGAYGLSIHQRVLREALPFLEPGGLLVLEMGLGQAKQLQLLFARSRAYQDVSFESDAAGAPRVVIGVKKAG